MEETPNTNSSINSVKFGSYEPDFDEKQEEQIKENYTEVNPDNLDEDPQLSGQKYVILSFLSPEGILNCKERAVKVRGVFDTLEQAQEHCTKLEKIDKYFKMFIGEVGKWLDFDPPAERVEKEMTSNKQYQKLLDAQRDQRMKNINDLAGKYKEMSDKKEKGKSERILENKKSNAAENLTSAPSSTLANNAKAPEPKTAVKSKQRNNVESLKKNMKKILETRQQLKQQHEELASETEASGQDQTDKNLEEIKKIIKERQS